MAKRGDLALSLGPHIVTRRDFDAKLGHDAPPICGIIDRVPQIQYSDRMKKSCVRFDILFIGCYEQPEGPSWDDHISVMCNVSDPPFKDLSTVFSRNIRPGDAVVFQDFKLPAATKSKASTTQHVWSRNGSSIQWYRIDNHGKLMAQRAGGKFSPEWKKYITSMLANVSKHSTLTIPAKKRAATGDKANRKKFADATPPPPPPLPPLPPLPSPFEVSVPARPRQPQHRGLETSNLHILTEAVGIITGQHRTPAVVNEKTTNPKPQDKPIKPIEPQKPNGPVQPVHQIAIEANDPVQVNESEENTDIEPDLHTDLEPDEPEPVELVERNGLNGPNGPNGPVERSDLIEPVEPVRPVESLKPVKPVELVEPVEPDEPVELVEPVEPDEPVEPVESVVPVVPMDVVSPTVDSRDEPIRSIEPDEPNEPNGSHDPNEPNDPMDGSNTTIDSRDGPIDPKEPKEPTEPTEPNESNEINEAIEPIEPIDANTTDTRDESMGTSEVIDSLEREKTGESAFNQIEKATPSIITRSLPSKGVLLNNETHGSASFMSAISSGTDTSFRGGAQPYSSDIEARVSRMEVMWKNSHEHTELQSRLEALERTMDVRQSENNKQFQDMEVSMFDIYRDSETLIRFAVEKIDQLTNRLSEQEGLTAKLQQRLERAEAHISHLTKKFKKS